jgi:hypothetical protein
MGDITELARPPAVASTAYENQGHDRTKVLSRILDAFKAEWEPPTADPKQLV